MSLADVKKAMDNFEKCRDANQKFGTYDSEVSRVVCRIITEAVKGKKPKIPSTTRGWQIYEMPCSEITASNLSALMNQVVQAIGNCTVFESNEKCFRDYICNYILYADLV